MKPSEMRFGGRKKSREEWLTPKELIEALGVFDLDPCSPKVRPFDTAKRHFTKEDNGLLKPWEGRVWLNPPYGSQTIKWVRRLEEHGDGIALIFARTDTKMFFNHVWSSADSLLFIKGRVRFLLADGRESFTSGGAPSVLLAYGRKNSLSLKESGISGAFVKGVKIFPKEDSRGSQLSLGIEC